MCCSYPASVLVLVSRHFITSRVRAGRCVGYLCVVRTASQRATSLQVTDSSACNFRRFSCYPWVSQLRTLRQDARQDLFYLDDVKMRRTRNVPSFSLTGGSLIPYLYGRFVVASPMQSSKAIPGEADSAKGDDGGVCIPSPCPHRTPYY